MPTNSRPLNNRKWNLGRLGLQPVRLRGLRGLRGLGDTIEYPVSVMDTGVIWNMPLVPDGAQNPSPTTTNGVTPNLTPPVGTPSTDPLDYVSPQQAIAAGLDPGKVYAAWSTSLQKFASPSAAISAGVPAGVVNQLWQDSANKKANTPPSFFSQSTFGIPNTILAAGLGAIVLLGVMKGRH
jgi:hypothetical protein